MGVAVVLNQLEEAVFLWFVPIVHLHNVLNISGQFQYFVLSLVEHNWPFQLQDYLQKTSKNWSFYSNQIARKFIPTRIHNSVSAWQERLLFFFFWLLDCFALMNFVLCMLLLVLVHRNVIRLQDFSLVSQQLHQLSTCYSSAEWSLMVSNFNLICFKKLPFPFRIFCSFHSQL